MNRRTFLTRAGGSLMGLAGTGIAWHALAQDGRDSQARGMITERTQQAIDTGLRYLADNQNANNGSFGTGAYAGNTAVTALGGLAFMAGGHQPGRGRFGANVTRAVEYILDHEDRNIPGFMSNQVAAAHGPMYGHGFATLFLAEVYGMVNDRDQRRRLRDALGRAISLIIRTQNHEGGWRYRPERADADLSVTICQIMALRAARNAGIAVPKTVADKCTEYVKACQDTHNTGGFSYQRGGFGPGFARTAAGVVALYSAGVYEGVEVEKGLEYLKKYRPGGNMQGGLFPNPDNMHYYYGHYYAVQAMWIRGGNYWREWYPSIRDELLASRQPQGYWVSMICPHYCTAMALIILQVPNNYLPILQR